MKKVKVKTEELLKILKKNRTRHNKAMNEVMKLYRKKAIAELDRALKAAKRGREIITDLNLVRPINMTKYYDQAIGMLEMTVDNVVEITQDEYSCYVLDKWHWNESVWHTATRYCNPSSSSSSSASSTSISSTTAAYLNSLQNDEED